MYGLYVYVYIYIHIRMYIFLIYGINHLSVEEIVTCKKKNSGDHTWRSKIPHESRWGTSVFENVCFFPWP
jgi:hypothetical protein